MKIKDKYKPCGHYTCDRCKKTYMKVTPHSEANKEAKELWGVENASEQSSEDWALVCDDCFKIIMKDLQ